MKENRLYYNAPANEWEEALPLGNGILGMMVFGKTDEERIQLSEKTIWSGWETDDDDNPQTILHLDEIRKLIFEGKYSEADELCNEYMVCRNKNRERMPSYG